MWHTLALWQWLIVLAVLFFAVSALCFWRAIKNATPHPDEQDDEYFCSVEGGQRTAEITGRIFIRNLKKDLTR